MNPSTVPAGCFRCTPNDSPEDGLCRACRVEIAAKLTDPDDPLVSVYHNGHGINHGTYRPDVTR